MPVYEYRCEDGHNNDVVLPRELCDKLVGHQCFTGGPCQKPLKRKYSVSFAPVMQEHYNPAVGKPISSMRQFRDELARSSEAATLKTGVLHDYQPADPNEGMKDD